MIISYDLYRFYAMIDYILVNLQPFFEKMYRNHIMGSEGERIWIWIRNKK